jgi:hypothetical protein
VVLSGTILKDIPGTTANLMNYKVLMNDYVHIFLLYPNQEG